MYRVVKPLRCSETRNGQCETTTVASPPRAFVESWPTPTREQLDKFVSLVQVADPTPLADVLDDDVLEFLRSFVHRR